MKRLAVAAVLAVLVSALAPMAGASEDSWRIWIRGDGGPDYPSFTPAQIGVYPGALDGYSQQITPYGGIEDGAVDSRLFLDVPGECVHVSSQIPGVTGLYERNIQSPTLPSPPKVWDLYVAANIKSAASVICLHGYTYSDSTLPPLTVGGWRVRYSLILLDNRGMAGAPANGTRWEIPAPGPFGFNNARFWTCPVNLPVIKLSAATNEAMAAEGYKIRFVQEVVPEPAGVLALGSGLIVLAGLVRRRRA